MVTKRVIQIIAAIAVVTAIAIGLGVTLGNKNNDNAATNNTSASKGSKFNNQCRRLIDGRYSFDSSPADHDHVFRKLNQRGTSYSGSSYSKGSYYQNPAICSKGSSISYPVYDPCNPVQYVTCACPTAPSYTYSNKGSYSKGSSKGSSYSYYSKGSYSSKGSSGQSKSNYSKPNNSKPAAASGGGSKDEWKSDGHVRLLMQWENDGYNVGSGGGGGGGGSKYSGGSKSSYSGGNKSSSYYSKSNSKSSYSKSSYSKSKGSYVSGGTCMCAITPYGYNYSKGSSSKGSNYYYYSKGSSKGSFVTGGSCTCLAPATVSKGSGSYYSKSKGSPKSSSYYSKSKGSRNYGLVPVPCPCSEPVVPVQPPALCEPTPRPTPKPTVAFIIPPTTPAPTPCEAQQFYLVNGVCTNDVFLLGGTSYRSAMQCCNINYGRGSMNNGNCQYVDICNTPAPVTPAPTPCNDQVFYFNGNVCSNAMAMPGATAYNTVMACCNMNFGMGSFNSGSCNIQDECNTPQPSPSPVTPAPTPCDAQVFYFDGNVCSNAIFIADAQAYNSVVVCCNQNFGGGSFVNGNCEYVDECNTEPPTPTPISTVVTDEPTPSPTTCEDQVFYFDGSSCTNELVLGDNVPSYNSLNPCCNQNFGPGSLSQGICEYTDICSTELPTPSPTTITNPPTFGNTPTVSTETTGPPTTAERWEDYWN